MLLLDTYTKFNETFVNMVVAFEKTEVTSKGETIWVAPRLSDACAPCKSLHTLYLINI